MEALGIRVLLIQVPKWETAYRGAFIGLLFFLMAVFIFGLYLGWQLFVSVLPR